MNARFRKLVIVLAETFWLLPALMVVGGILLAIGLIRLDRIGAVPAWMINSVWVYNGGGTGARTLLGAVASSTIGVAGTVFSITIAALSLAAGQMGPRLLRNFTHDRGNQLTLGAFLGTFSYALMVLRSVRTESEGAFVPNLALSVSILLAFVCVGMLVFFVGHMAGRINVDTVVDLVSDDVRAAIRRLTLTKAPPPPPPDTLWHDGVPLRDDRRGYLQQLHSDGLADWASAHGVMLRLTVRPGDYVFPGAPIGLMRVLGDAKRDGQDDGTIEELAGEAEAAIRDATALGGSRGSSLDLEFTIRQLVEVAVRALSPGINDPHTAMAVLDRLASALCDLVPMQLDSGVTLRDGRVRLVVPVVSYDGLTDGMFHMIRQNAASSLPVLMRLIEVLTAVASCERQPARISSLRRHVMLVVDDAKRHFENKADLAELCGRQERFEATLSRGIPFWIGGDG